MRSDRLKLLRERAGHTQESFAELVGRDIKQIWRWETGKASPSAEALVDIAKALNVSSDYLLGLIDDPTMVISADMDEIEHEIIGLLRRLDARDHIIILGILQMMADNQQSSFNIKGA